MNIHKVGTNMIQAALYCLSCSLYIHYFTHKSWKLNLASICLLIHLNLTSHFHHNLHRTNIKHSHVLCQRLNKLPFFVSDVYFVWRRGTPARGDNFISKLWPQMRERQSDRVQYMSTFHGTNGMSVKRRYTDAFSPERPEMLSGDAALLFRPYSGCTGNILSFLPLNIPSLHFRSPDY